MDVIDRELAAVTTAQQSMKSHVAVFHHRLKSIADKAKQIKEAVSSLERGLHHIAATKEELSIAAQAYVTPPVMDAVLKRGVSDTDSLCRALEHISDAQAYLERAPTNPVGERLERKVTEQAKQVVRLVEGVIVDRVQLAIDLFAVLTATTTAAAGAASSAAQPPMTTGAVTSLQSLGTGRALVVRPNSLQGIPELIRCLWVTFRRLDSARQLLRKLFDRIDVVLQEESLSTKGGTVRGGGGGAANSSVNGSSVWGGTTPGSAMLGESRDGGGVTDVGADGTAAFDDASSNGASFSASTSRKRLLALGRGGQSIARRRYIRGSHVLIHVSRRARALVLDAAQVFRDAAIVPLEERGIDRDEEGRSQLSPLLPGFVLDLAKKIFKQFYRAQELFGWSEAVVLLGLDFFDEAWQWTFTVQRLPGTTTELQKAVQDEATSMRRHANDVLSLYRDNKGTLNPLTLIRLVGFQNMNITAVREGRKDDAAAAARSPASDAGDNVNDEACAELEAALSANPILDADDDRRAATRDDDDMVPKSVQMLLGLNDQQVQDIDDPVKDLPLEVRLSWLPTPDGGPHESTTELVGSLKALVRDYQGALAFTLYVPSRKRRTTGAVDSAAASPSDSTTAEDDANAMKSAAEYLESVIIGHMSDLRSVAMAASVVFTGLEPAQWRRRYHRPHDTQLANNFGQTLFLINNVHYVRQRLAMEPAFQDEHRQAVVGAVTASLGAMLDELTATYERLWSACWLPPVLGDAEGAGTWESISEDDDRPLSKAERLKIKNWFAVFSDAVANRTQLEGRRLVADVAMRQLLSGKVRDVVKQRWSEAERRLHGRRWSDRPERWLAMPYDAMILAATRMFVSA